MLEGMRQRFGIICVAFLLLPAPTLAFQTGPRTSPEQIAFQAVNSATSPAARLAAAEDFVANFPGSSRRPEVARLVSEQLAIVRNTDVAITLVNRARLIFTSAAELEFLQPAALEIYLNGNRTDDAFATGAEFFMRKPDELWALVKLTHLGAQEAKNRNTKFAEPSLSYGLRAIDLIEKQQKPPAMKEETWLDFKSKLPGLYMQVAIISLAQGRTGDARIQIKKAVQLAPNDPVGFGLLGRVLNSEYEKASADYQRMAEGGLKQDEKHGLDMLLNEIVDAYARAVAFATGKPEHQTLLQQVVPDLTSYYKYRHNGSVSGLQQLIQGYRNEALKNSAP